MIPQYIIDKLSDFRKREVEGNQAGNANFYGQVEILPDWGRASYNDKVFLNTYLFGDHSLAVPSIEDRVIRPQEIPGAVDEKTAYTFLFDDAVTRDYMSDDGLGKYARFSAVPIIDRFFSSSGNSLPVGSYEIKDLEQRLYNKITDPIFNSKWRDNKVPNFFLQNYYDTDPEDIRLKDPKYKSDQGSNLFYYTKEMN